MKNLNFKIFNILSLDYLVNNNVPVTPNLLENLFNFINALAKEKMIKTIELPEDFYQYNAKVNKQEVSFIYKVNERLFRLANAANESAVDMKTGNYYIKRSEEDKKLLNVDIPSSSKEPSQKLLNVLVEYTGNDEVRLPNPVISALDMNNILLDFKVPDN